MNFSRRFPYLVLIFSALFALTTATAFASGATWTSHPSAGAQYWIGITSSADGTHLAATAYNYYSNNVAPGYIYTSTNGGTTWATSTAPAEYWTSITSSADGMDLAAVVDGGDIYTSTNGGSTWATSTAPSENWYGITSSSNGTDLAASVYGGDIYTTRRSIRAVGAGDPVPRQRPQRRSLRSPELHRRPRTAISLKRSRRRRRHHHRAATSRCTNQAARAGRDAPRRNRGHHRQGIKNASSSLNS